MANAGMKNLSAISKTLRMPLVGRKHELELIVSRQNDDPGLPLRGVAAVQVASGDDAHTVVAMRHDLSADGFDGLADAVVEFIDAHGWRIRNLTRFRYDLETEVRRMDASLREAARHQVDPRSSLLDASMEQVSQMMDELPLSKETSSDLEVIAMFRVAMGNVIRAAYDAGYRDGSSPEVLQGGKIADDALRIPGDTW